VRNLSKDNSKIQRYGGQILRKNAGAGVCNVRDGARVDAGLRAEEQQGFLPIFVLPIDRRSSIIRILDEPFVDPAKELQLVCLQGERSKSAAHTAINSFHLQQMKNKADSMSPIIYIRGPFDQRKSRNRANSTTCSAPITSVTKGG
jgi:hypothetical protein